MDISGKYIISGGPGAGKTTLIDELRRRGYTVSDEVSRKMIMQEVELGSDCLPWKDIACFSDKVLDDMLIALGSSSSSLLTFFDRGIPDIIAYLLVAGLPVPEKFHAALATQPYCKRVFILPPWEEIYVNDPERWQSYTEAMAISEVICSTYLSYSFELIIVPPAPLAERVDFVIAHCK